MYDIPKDQIVLIDFGFAQLFDQSNPVSITKRSGSVEYCAPEVYFASEYDGRQADVWSLGVLLFVLLFHHFPFPSPKHSKKGANSRASRREEVEASFAEKAAGSLVMPAGASYEVKSLLRSMLSPDPTLRLTTTQIMRHPWFANLNNPQHVHIQRQLLRFHFRDASPRSHLMASLERHVDLSPREETGMQKLLSSSSSSSSSTSSSLESPGFLSPIARPPSPPAISSSPQRTHPHLASVLSQPFIPSR